MKRSWVRLLGLAVAGAILSVPAFAQTTNPPAVRPAPAQPQVQAEQIQGQIIRTSPDRFVVKTRDNREVTFFHNPDTRYLLNSKVVPYSDLRVGSNITAAYTMEGDRYIANNVTLVPVTTQGTVLAPVPAPPAEGTLVEGQVIRVAGQDQVILRTPAGKEVIVYVSPQTVYQINGEAGAFTDLRPGVDIGVNYDVRDRRFMARRIFRRNR
jgi:hypothetical protein